MFLRGGPVGAAVAVQLVSAALSRLTVTIAVVMQRPAAFTRCGWCGSSPQGKCSCRYRPAGVPDCWLASVADWWDEAARPAEGWISGDARREYRSATGGGAAQAQPCAESPGRPGWRDDRGGLARFVPDQCPAAADRAQTPFGVVGPSIVVQGAQTKVGLDPVFYRSKSAALAAIDQGQLYGAYVTGRSRDTLIVVPAKSFFGQLEIEPAFLAAAHKLHRPVTV